MKKNCTTCKLAIFTTTPSGRRNLDMGECTANVNLPRCFEDYRGEMPVRRYINKYTKLDCVLWEKTK